MIARLGLQDSVKFPSHHEVDLEAFCGREELRKYVNRLWTDNETFWTLWNGPEGKDKLRASCAEEPGEVGVRTQPHGEEILD